MTDGRPYSDSPTETRNFPKDNFDDGMAELKPVASHTCLNPSWLPFGRGAA